MAGLALAATWVGAGRAVALIAAGVGIAGVLVLTVWAKQRGWKPLRIRPWVGFGVAVLINAVAIAIAIAVSK
jgi:predicted membrane channel-forming protein YqfA (hemolysin III family)